jgi:hypothetical protein
MSSPSFVQLRWALGLGLAVMAGAVAIAPAPARFRRPDLENVPVARILDNLQQQVRKSPKDMKARFNLARAHAMAYASKSPTVPIWKGREAEGVWFGYTPPHVPFSVKSTKDEALVKAAKTHLAKAVTLYEEVVRAQPDNLTARLGLAWALEQSGDKARAIPAYRKVIDDGWKKEKDMKRAPLGWHSVTGEAARYLLPLLDKDKDKVEIATLRARIKTVQAIPRPVTPIVVPLRQGLRLADLVDPSASVPFDADGSGLSRRWSWVTKDAGWLVYDPSGQGRVTSALQMFGNVSFWLFWDNGYEALRALDDNGDGVLTGKELHGLAIWQDLNRNGVCDPGEVRSVAEWGIVAISCRPDRDKPLPGCAAQARQGVTFRDGTRRATYDVILTPR